MHLFVPKDEVYRHLILKIIIDKELHYSSEKNETDCKEIAVHIEELAKALKLSVKKTKIIVGGLIISEDIQRCEQTDDKFLFILAHKGYTSYAENVYLKRGRTYRMMLVKDNLYIIVSLIAILSSISSLALYLTSTRNTQKEVIELRNEIKTLKESISPKLQKTK